MSKTRLLSKLIIPIALIAIYSITLYKTATAPVEPFVEEEEIVYPPVPSEKEEAALPRIPQASPAPGTAVDLNSLPEGEAVLGVNVGGEFRVYVLADFGPGHVVLNDILGEIPIVVFIEQESKYAMAFQAEVNGRKLTFSSDGETIVDDSGSTWSLSGEAIDGLLAGEHLAYVISFVTEWQEWVTYHPETTIYGR